MEREIIRSRRKTLAISVDKSGRLIVRAPLGLSEERIDEFIRSKADWIERHSEEAAERSLDRSRRLSSPPEALPLLGEMCRVRHETPPGYIGGCFNLPENTALEELLPYLRRLYAAIAKETLIPRTAIIAGRMGITPSAVKINSARTRWGSCSSQKVINLSWKLIAADPSLIDYVIVHELCHTVHMNHSPAFWAMVEQVIPDYPERREALKAVQRTLSEYGLE